MFFLIVSAIFKLEIKGGDGNKSSSFILLFYVNVFTKMQCIALLSRRITILLKRIAFVIEITFF